MRDAPHPSWSARRFAVWWLRAKPFNIPAADAVRWYTDFTGVTLYRTAPFQVQLFIVRASRVSPWHSHPNIDSVEYGIAGDGQASFASERNLRIGGLVLIAPGEGHEAGAGPSGGAFISLQKWLNGVEPTSVELDWEGSSIDDQHHKELTRP
jgi:quercetin dioxygenase-like cupin family protein